MVAGSNCCDPLAFHFFRGLKGGLFEGRRRVDFLRDESDDEFAAYRMMRGTTRPIIVDWNQDGHQDILMAYKGYRSFFIQYGGRETVNSLLNLPVIENHVKSESFYSTQDRAGWRPEFERLTIPALARLLPKNERGLPIRTKIGVLVGGKRIVVEQSVLDWIEVADWDNDGNPDLLVNVKKHRWPYGKSAPHIGDGRTPYHKCPPHLWTLYLLRNVGFCGKPTFGKPQQLFAAPPYKQIGAFTVADVDSDGSPEIVAALGNIDPNSKNKWAAEYRFFVLGPSEQLAALNAQRRRG